MMSSPDVTDIQNNNSFEYANSPESDGSPLLTNSSKALPPNKLSRHYRCDKCDFSTTRSRIFLCHQVIRHHDSTNIFLCNVCDYASRWRCKVTRHFNMLHRDLSPLKEHDVVFKEAAVVWEEHRRVNGDCIESASSDDTAELDRLAEFLGSSSEENNKRHFVDENSMKNSSRKRSMKKNANQCSQCGEKFIYSNFLTEYSVDHRCQSNEFTCEICFAILQNHNDVIIHAKEHKNNQSEAVGGVSSSGDMVCICPVCGYSAPSPSLQDRHMETVHGEQALSNNAVLDPNNEQHSLNRCDSSNSLSTPLINHDISVDTVSNSPDWEQALSIDSTGEMSISGSGDRIKSKTDQSITDSRRRYRCNVCAATFPWHGDLAEHLKVEHGMEKSRDWRGKAGSFRCTSCKYVAKYQSELRRHMRLHLGVKPFGCVFCQYRSAWKGDLKRHIESHHRDRFTNDFQLCKIMARYKNNAGTADSTIDSTADSNSIKDESFPGGIEMDNSFNNNETFGVPPSSEIFSESLNLMQSDSNISNNRHSREFGSNPSSPLPKTNASCFSSDAIKDISSNKTNTNSDCLAPFKKTNDDLSPEFGAFNPLAGLSYDNPLLTESQLSSLAAMNPDQQLALSKQTQNLFNCQNLLFSQLMLSNPEAFATLPFPTNNSTPISAASFLGHPDSIQFNSTKLNQEAISLNYLSETVKDSDSPGCKASPNLSEGGGANCIHSNNGSVAGSITNAKSEQYKRFKCSGCGHRSNWKWDINKHIKVAHPERSNIKTIMLSLEEARNTLSSYLSSARASKSRMQGSGADSEEGYYRPYKCSLCGHRSNWKWDVNKHIKQLHQGGAYVITLSMDDAKKTIGQYKDRRRQAQLAAGISANSSTSGLQSRNKLKIDSKLEQSSPPSLPAESNEAPLSDNKPQIIHASTAPNSCGSFASDPSPRIDTLRLKRFKCSVCGYRSNYRSDIARHNRRKHSGQGHVVILDEIDAKNSLDMYMRDFPQRSHSYGTKLHQYNVMSRENSSKERDDVTKNPLVMNMAFVWKCCLCSFSHKDRLNALDHVSKAHRPAKPFSCKLCSYGTDYRNSLIRHIKAKHPHRSDIMHCIKQNLKKVRANNDDDNSPFLNMTNPTGHFNCQICSQSCSNYADFVLHIQSHVSSDEELFELFNSNPAQCSLNTVGEILQCPECPYTTFRQDVFKIHQFQHWKECGYPHTCSYCTYKSSRPTWMKNHEKLHFEASIIADATDLRIHKRSSEEVNNDMPLDFTIKKSDASENNSSNNYQNDMKPIKLTLKRTISDTENGGLNEDIDNKANDSSKRARLNEFDNDYVHKSSLFRCKQCPFFCISIKDFIIHRAGHNISQKTFFCNKCRFLTRSRFALKKHKRVHSPTYYDSQIRNVNLNIAQFEKQNNQIVDKVSHHLEKAKKFVNILLETSSEGFLAFQDASDDVNLQKSFIQKINHLQKEIYQKTQTPPQRV